MVSARAARSIDLDPSTWTGSRSDGSQSRLRLDNEATRARSAFSYGFSCGDEIVASPQTIEDYMPKAFVHGNPETSALWRAVVESLNARGIDDISLLSPPGFGAPVPIGWEPNQANYCDWLVGELEALGGNVDLVGHDWGAGHVYGALAQRPDLLRSWAADCAGLVHPDYVWHDMALLWQTPEVGEQAVAAMTAGSLEERTAGLVGLGMRADVAAEIAAAQDEEMTRCILVLYRSAAQPAMRELGERLRSTAQRPGLVLIATEDPYTGTPEMASEVATTLGARTVTLEGLGHWWMFDGAEAAANALVAHWAEASGAS
jgi:pimeloyl-ACP methyl ester carboxylesterase